LGGSGGCFKNIVPKRFNQQEKLNNTKKPLNNIEKNLNTYKKQQYSK